MKILSSLLRMLVCFASLVVANIAWSQVVPTWTSIGPAGGSVTEMLADPLVPKTTLYAGSDENGVFVSNDAGSTWHFANNGLAGGTTGQRHIYAMVALGNSVLAATNTGLYMTAAGGTPMWSPVTSPLPPTANGTVDDLMIRVDSVVYFAARGGSTVYSASVISANPVWSVVEPLPVQTDQNPSPVTALGQMAGKLAIGSTGVVYVQDDAGHWVNSETTLERPSLLAGDSIAAVVSTSSRWAFTCTMAGTVFKIDLSEGLLASWTPLAWDPTGTFAASVSDTCHGLSVARLGSNGESVLVMTTPTGAFVSDVFDEIAAVPGSMVPGPEFSSMSSAVNGAFQLDSAALTPVLWATEFGIYSTTVNGPDSLTRIKGPASALMGPAKIATPSQRLNNVNMHDIAVIGSSVYAIASSVMGSYADVMTSADGGITWKGIGLRSQFVHVGTIRSLAADKAHSVLYAGTDQGIFAYSQATSSWAAVGKSYDVMALAVGAQALYSGRKSSASNLPNSALVIQPLIGGASFTPLEASPGDHFNVRSLVVKAGSVYVGGGSSQDAGDTDTGPYNNTVYFAPDVTPGATFSPPTWKMVSSEPFTDVASLSSMEVAGSEVFVGGDGFLKRCRIGAGSWGPVVGVPMLNSEAVGITTLATDGQTLFVGTAGQGLLALSLATNTSNLIPVSGVGDAGLPSAVIHGLRSVDGTLYVATPAGLSTATTLANSGGSGAGSGGASSGSGGGGCSMALATEPDPLLWILIAIATIQIVATRRYRTSVRQFTFARQSIPDNKSL